MTLFGCIIKDTYVGNKWNVFQQISMTFKDLKGVFGYCYSKVHNWGEELGHFQAMSLFYKCSFKFSFMSESCLICYLQPIQIMEYLGYGFSDI